MKEDLKWLAENVHEWPEDKTHVIVSEDHKQHAFISGFGDMPSKYTGDTFTREQWQAARDELGLNHSVEPTEKVWNGPEDGLPPVDTECEVEWNENVWRECLILFITTQSVLIRFVNEGTEHIIRRNQRCSFRPIRTEEDKAVDKMMQILKHRNWSMENAEIPEICRTLYRDGLRFTEEAK